MKNTSPLNEAKYEIWLAKMLKDKPKYLYKYRNLDNPYNRKTIFEKELFLSSARNFNDPFDCSIPFILDDEDLSPDKVFERVYRNLRGLYPDKTEAEIHELCFDIQKNGHMTDDGHYQDLENWHNEEVFKNFGILSLAREENNFLMWSHYSSSHKGYCLGFNTEELCRKVSGYLDVVVYQRELPTIQLPGPDMESINAFLQKILCVKSDNWSYEKEYRIIKNAHANEVVKFDPSIVTEINLGCKMPYEEKMELLKLAKNDYPDAKVYEMKLSKTDFSLDKHRLL